MFSETGIWDKERLKCHCEIVLEGVGELSSKSLYIFM